MKNWKRLVSASIVGILLSSNAGWASHPTGQADPLWIEGEALRSMLEPMRSWAGDSLDTLMDWTHGVRLTKGQEQLQIDVLFKYDISLQLKPASKAGKNELYQVLLPKYNQLKVRVWDGNISIAPERPIEIHVNLSVISDRVYLRSVNLDLASGKFEVEAGVLGNSITVVAHGSWVAKKLDGVDIWETIARNLDWMAWPAVIFE